MVPRLEALDLDLLVEDQLALQTEISYPAHHAYLKQNGLKDCKQVLDLGTGTGVFVSRLASDHPEIYFTGIDKRTGCIENARLRSTQNLRFDQVDVFNAKSKFDYSFYDGYLLRYFLLHVDHSVKLLRSLKERAKAQSRFWIIDLDVSQFKCVPSHPGFDQLTAFVHHFCARTSVESHGGEKVPSILNSLGFKKIEVTAHPFTFQNTSRANLIRYLRQEVLCYAAMSGQGATEETESILSFIDRELGSGKHEISYGMILVSATA